MSENEILVVLRMITSGATQELNAFLSHAGNGLKEFALTAAGTFGIALTVEQLAEKVLHMGEEFVTASVKMRQLSQIAATTTEEMSGLAFAADVNSVGVDTLTRGYKALAEWMVKTGQAGKDIRNVFLDQAELFARMENGARKDAIAVERFGRSGLQLIPMLNQGREELSRFIEEGQMFSGITEEGARTSHEFEIAVKELKLSIESWSGSLLMTFMPAITKSSEALAKFFAMAREGVNAFSASSMVGQIVGIAKDLTGKMAKGVLGGLTPQESAMTKSELEEQVKLARNMLETSKLTQELINNDHYLSPEFREKLSNRELQEQVETLKALIAVTNTAERFGAIGHDEAESLTKKYDMQAKLAQQKIQPTSVGGNFLKDMTDEIAQWGTKAQQIAHLFRDEINTAISSVSQNLTGVIMGTEKWDKALKNIWSSILNEGIQSIIKMGMQWVITHLIMGGATKAFHALAIALGWEQAANQNAQEASKIPALTTTAALSSVSSYGAAAVIGIAALVAAIGIAVGLMASHRELGGPVEAGRPYIVGERRAELFVPRTSGHIMSSVPQPSGGREGSAVNMKIDVHNWNDERAMTEHIRDNPETHHVILDKVKRNGHYVGIRQ